MNPAASVYEAGPEGQILEVGAFDDWRLGLLVGLRYRPEDGSERPWQIAVRRDSVKRLVEELTRAAAVEQCPAQFAERRCVRHAGHTDRHGYSDATTSLQWSDES